MGKRAPDQDDLAERVTEAALAAVAAVTPSFTFTGTANLALSLTGGATGTAVLDKSFDGGTTWLPASNLGVVVTLTAPCAEVIFSREAGVLHRVRRTGGTGAGFTARLSQ